MRSIAKGERRREAALNDQRLQASIIEHRSDSAVRRRLVSYGLRVICLACKRPARHWPEVNGRLRNRVCPHCDTPSCMRAFWWVRKFPDRAAAEVKAAVRLMTTLDADCR